MRKNVRGTMRLMNVPSASLIEDARERWRAAGVALHDVPMTAKMLADGVRRASAQTARGRLIPTSFDPETEDLTVFPRHRAWRWQSAEDLFAAYRDGGVMMRLPLFWQLEMPLFDACRRAGTFVFVNDKGNAPLGAAALSHASMRVVAADAADANEFATHLLMNGRDFPAAWLIIQDPERMQPLSPALTGSGSVLRQEIHLMPGFPVLWQCARLANTNDLFHENDHVLLEQGQQTFVSGEKDDPLPLVRYAVPLQTSDAGVCECGKKTVRCQAA